MFKKMSLVALLLSLLPMMAACSSAETPAESESEPAATEAPAEEAAAEEAEAPADDAEPAEEEAEESAAEPAEFTFTGWALNEGASRDVVMGYVNDYAAANNATISDQAFPWGEMLNQLVLQASGGTAEGAAQLDIAWLSTLAATGALKDLSDYAANADYTDAALRSGQVDGVQYGLPWTTGSIGLVANQQILDEAGVEELPTTIEEFEAALEQIQAYDPEIIPYAGMTTVDGLKDIIPWMWTFGGEVIDADGNLVLDSEANVAALEWYKDLMDRGLVAAEMDRFTARQLFSQGNVAFYDDAIVVKGIVTADTPIENLGDLIVPVPRPVVAEGDDPQSMLWGHLIVVFEGENGDASAEWAQYLTSDEATTLDYFEQMALPPTTETALTSDVVQNDEFIANWSQNVTATSKLNPFWPYPESARMEAVLAEQVQAYLVGSVDSAQEALATASAEISDLMQ